MLTDRILVILLLIPVGVALFVDDGMVLLVAGVLLVMNLAAIEYARLFARSGIRVSAWLVCAGSSLLVFMRWVAGFDHAGILLCFFVLLTIGWYLFQYERGDDQAATGMVATVNGWLYFGWLTAYFISLRALPNGLWWTLTILPSVWFADSAAYLVGSRWGRHAMTKRLSPKKTWEGYAGGVFFGGLASGLFASVWQFAAGPASGITPWSGLALGLFVAALSPLGDLAISMIKRQVGAKDSGTLLPGHGGALDRIDSWLVTAPIGYYAVIGFLFLFHLPAG
jgi:phosphatidate cytidylyltransferase